MALKFFLALLFILLSPAGVHAAFSIESITPTEITSVDQELTLFVTASNLSSSTQYFQVAITKEGQSNFLGQTQNNSGSWTPYASSPDFNSLLAVTPIGGVWNGEVKAKFDSNDSGFSGPGTYLIKILKYITSSGSSSNSVPITVLIPSVVEGSVTPTMTQETKEEKKTPTIQFSTSNNLKVGEEFEISFNLINFEPGKYYVKVRMGKDSSHLSLGQTYGSEWLGDTDSYSKFPQVSGGSKVKVRLSPTADPGNYIVKVRLKSIDTDKTFDSEEKTLTFKANPLPQTTTTKAPIQTQTLSTNQKSITSQVLAVSTGSASLAAFINERYKNKNMLATISAKTIKTNSKKPLNLLIPQKVDEEFQLGGISAIGGFILICASAGFYLKKKLSEERDF